MFFFLEVDVKRIELATFLSLWFLLPATSFALSNTARVPVLLYHAGEAKQNPDTGECDYGHYAAKALADDLELLHNQQITVIPLYWLAEWALGLRDGSTLPAKVVAITSDDGANDNWFDVDLTNTPYPCGPTRKGFKSVIQEFKARHPEYEYWSP